MARLFVLAGAVVTGLIIADILIHPQGTNAASQGITSIETPAISGLLGVAPNN